MVKSKTGDRRHFVTWQTPSFTRDPNYGSPIENWTFIANRYAQIKEVKSIQKLNEQPQQQSTYIVTQPFLPTLDTTCRMTFNGNTYKISGILNVEQRSIEQIITVVCTGVVS